MSETTTGSVKRYSDAADNRDALLFAFGVDSAALGSEHSKYLDELVAFVAASSTPLTLSMDGFASHTGAPAYNQTLSEKREKAVENYLRSNSKVFEAGSPNTINPNFHGFSDSPPGENPLFRSVRVVAHRPSVVPPPVPITPPGPSSATVGKFEIDLVGWIPQPEVDNPLSILPGAIKAHLPPGMADPFFGGDNYSTPPASLAGMVAPSHTFRATQHVDFTITTWGTPPSLGSVTTTPGITTCLDARRSAGGKVTFSLTAKLIRASASVTYSASDDWYDVALSGLVADPVPAAAAAALTKALPYVPAAVKPLLVTAIGSLAMKVTPALSWDAVVRIQHGGKLGRWTTASYAPCLASESSGRLPGASSVLVPGPDLIHGRIHFSEWPSALIWLKFSPAVGAPSSQPIFFSSGASIPWPEPAFIEVPKLCKIRQVTW